MTRANTIPFSPIALDDLDLAIIGLLKTDGRMSFTEVAKRLNLPEATARYRVQRLLQSKVVKIHATPNPEHLGTPRVMIVQLFVENGKIDAVAAALVEIDEVQFVAITAGHHNIVIDVCFGTHDELLAFYDKLHQIPGVIRYESQVVMKLLKAEYKYVLS
ncbi:MAG: Lrp/AsnC family transcriptional regulator [Synechococcales cyanobacterium C42_A2020_086]|jgi:Lrp/AsnC family transcriptional regulator for asnA, asnC and gidA|nr:Lrp/AsnC family transcriptional regulator [Synechococcales cyanobacterium M58_A2018_015]MBF2075547.1 Lrp/AsnC family transcriptional regulator [Synechococcales cyanobacterium C42_A2020_086]